MNHLLQNNNNNNNNNNKHDKIQQIYFENHRSAVFKKKAKPCTFSQSTRFSKRRQTSTLSARDGTIDCAHFPMLFTILYFLRLATELSIAMDCLCVFSQSV